VLDNYSPVLHLQAEKGLWSTTRDKIFHLLREEILSGREIHLISFGLDYNSIEIEYKGVDGNDKVWIPVYDPAKVRGVEFDACEEVKYFKDSLTWCEDVDVAQGDWVIGINQKKKKIAMCILDKSNKFIRISGYSTEEYTAH
jgi:hypothetical protein